MALSLSPELLDSIFHYVDVSPQQLLICRSWYRPICRRLLRDIQMSSSTLFRIPLLSAEYMELLYRYTHSVSIILVYPEHTGTYEHPMPYSLAWLYGINAALIELASKIVDFQRLQTFTFCNFLEVETSWHAIHMSTFESILSGLSSHNLEFVKIDFPGAELENRIQLNQHRFRRSHLCETISRHFPQARHVYLRTREICADLLQFKYICQPLLETFTINLDLETSTRHELDIDRYVLDCEFNECFGRNLLNVLVSKAENLSRCSNVPKLNTVRFLCKCPDNRYMPSASVSNTEDGVVWTVSLRSHQ